MKMIKGFLAGISAASIALTSIACSSSEKAVSEEAKAPLAAGTLYSVRDTTVLATFDAAGVAEPLQQATLSTKLMGTVTSVLVREGDIVAAGQPLVRIDARDIDAKGAQVAASAAEADAIHRDALTQAQRIRALYADSAATRAQLDAVETGLARAEAGVRTARAAIAEISAVRSYSLIRAPFSGVVTQRFVDAGAFAAPGAPLVSIQDGSKIRLTANATPDVASAIRRGQTLGATVEGHPYQAVVEGVIPASAGNLYTINALVSNPESRILPGSAAVISIPAGTRRALFVPLAAIAREGDLTGVTVRTADGDERRWVRLGVTTSGVVEVVSGLRAGDQVLIPATAPRLASEN